MTKNDSSQESDSNDDLTAIKGIGPARQDWLVKAFAVRTFADLAALSVEDIEAARRAEKQPMLARSDIHDWLVQAKDFAAASGHDPDQLAEPDPVDSEEGSAEEEPAEAPAPPEWKPFASFVVEYRQREGEGQAEAFQTSVHHVEEDVSEAWPGLDAEAPWQWMLDRVQKETLPEPEEAIQAETKPSDVSLSEGTEMAIQITDLYIRQPVRAEESMAIDRSDRMSSSFIKSTEAFALDVAFELVGPAADDVAKKEIPFQSQLYARDLSTGKSLHLGNSTPGRLIEGDMSYMASLHWAKLPRGTYQMQALVLVQSAPPIPGHIEGSIVQVV
ncbi:MAG: hypothetical protein ACR2QF_15500 [Geminicoccaceae bacterium]